MSPVLYKAKNNKIIKIRDGELDDLPMLFNIDLKSYDFIWSEDTWLENFKTVRVAEYENRIVAFCVANTRESTLRILKLAVSPGFRRISIGSFLLHDVLKCFPKMEYITILVGESQAPALAFINHHNLKLKHEIDSYPSWPSRERGFFFVGRIIRESTTEGN